MENEYLEQRWATLLVILSAHRFRQRYKSYVLGIFDVPDINSSNNSLAYRKRKRKTGQWCIYYDDLLGSWITVTRATHTCQMAPYTKKSTVFRVSYILSALVSYASDMGHEHLFCLGPTVQYLCVAHCSRGNCYTVGITNASNVRRRV